MFTAKILIVEDDYELLEALSDTLSQAGYDVVTASDGEQALSLLADTAVNLVVSDIQMPNINGQQLLKNIREQHTDIPVMLMTAYGSIQQAVDAMRDGAVDYLVKPFEAEVLVNMVSRYIGQPSDEASAMIVADAKSVDLLKLAKKVADSDATVMITGESGVGKEVLARYIHNNSLRAEHPFIAINCAAIPENMLEATLFGYEKGAYTGAYKASPGKFELANGGTLLLDEISEMDMGLQTKLLRVLQEREVERLGGNKLIELDVRILATSNRQMRLAVQDGEFREDLFYRLNVFPLHVAPLRERPADILPIVERLLEKYAIAASRSIPSLDVTARNKISSYHWPGNVRELDNVIQRSLIIQKGDNITEDDIHFEMLAEGMSDAITESNVSQRVHGADKETLNRDLKQHEWDLIVKAIRDARGSRKRTAEKLGISQRTLRYKLAKMREEGIHIPNTMDMEAI